MREYKKWTMQIDKEPELLLYDGEHFVYKNFESLQKVCGCRKVEFMGKQVYDDNDTYIRVNDDVMDGITDYNPAGTWNEDNTMWSWGIHINKSYVTFRYYV